MTREEISALLDRLNLNMTAVFIPWSQSRNYKAKSTIHDWSLNWRVTIQHGPRDLFTTDYSAGIGHCPSYKQSERFTIDYVGALEYETEHGRSNRSRLHAIKLDRVDVFYSLVSDASVIDYPSFESWAGDMDYDTDSRKGEAIYRECLQHALALRAAIGEDGLRQLREAYQDF